MSLCCHSSSTFPRRGATALRAPAAPASGRSQSTTSFVSLRDEGVRVSRQQMDTLRGLCAHLGLGDPADTLLRPE